MRFVCTATFLLFFSSFGMGQESRAEVYGGYQYLNIDTNGLSPRQGANGWEASVSSNFNKWFAVEGDVSGAYKSYSVDLSALNLGTLTVKVSDYAYAGGPRLNLKPAFVHALFGGDHLAASAQGYSVSQDGLVGLVGGGIQWKVSGPWSIRGSADYVFTRHNIFGGSPVTQNNFRAGAGVVYSFGARSEKLEKQDVPETTNLKATVVKIDLLGLAVVERRGGGAQIIDEIPNGPASSVGLQRGDVINAVDGHPIRTPKDIAAAMSGRKAGETVRLGYLIRGGWQTETTIALSGPSSR